MLSRRTLLSGATAALATQSSEAAAEGKPLRFGIIADPQYADAAPNLGLNRYYANTPAKLRAAVEILNREALSFVATLGDIIDRDATSYAHILPIYAELRHRTHFLLGNHDFSVDADARDSVPERLGMPGRYYDFVSGGVRFVVLDGNEVSLFGAAPDSAAHAEAAARLGTLQAANAPNGKPWNGTLSDAQFTWLGERLDRARANGERVVVLNHYPVLPDNMHNLWDADRLVALLTRHPSVVAYFNGHNHAGNYAERDGIHFVNFRGMVDTPDENAFAVVAIDGVRMEVTGYGREPSRSLTLRTA